MIENFDEIIYNFDEFVYKYKYLIGGVLIFIILAGVGIIIADKYHQNNINKENQAITELKNQNEQLRQQLSGQAQQQVAGVATVASQNIGSKININTASLAELDKIPNIGPARAADIISYRESKNGFKTIEEMKNIKGIGDKTFESMKDLITVGN